MLSVTVAACPSGPAAVRETGQTQRRCQASETRRIASSRCDRICDRA